MIDLAIISDQPTPYRLHVLTRLARELPGVRVHNVFTHNYLRPNQPWQVALGPELRPIHFEQYRLDHAHPLAWRGVKLFGRVRDYLIEHEVKLVIVLGYRDLTRLLLLRWAAKRGLPVLLTGDSNVFGETGRPAWRYAIKRTFLRWVLAHVAGLMPMGTCGRAYFRLFVDHDKPTFLFPYEPDYQALTRRDPQAAQAFMAGHGLDPQRKRMLYCGRLARVKRVDVLLDAFARVAQADESWDLILAGDGPLRGELEARVPPALRERVRFLGFLQMGDAIACYQSCDALVHPSEFEPWALVINEAVAAGLAVVTTEVVGAAVELVRHGTNGLIVPPGNVEALALALRRLMQPGECRRMKEQSAGELARWRAAADPVEGVRDALRHFQLEPGLENPMA